ncbi:PLP-dependent aminotransferase family protein [Streptomyces sp. BI20]|uniref:aminotransferase-like domain-containing protein n=1 Tax=Streptomyces sp. BI20 TaxID=3403460 RepID=UPI003C709B2B
MPGPRAASGAGGDLHLELAAQGPRRTALARALREAVRSGRLRAGARLPPYRSLAADLGLARGVVADAYAELVAEGWFTARQGSGTRVAEGALPAPGPAAGGRNGAAAAGAPAPYDLNQGRPDPAAFPRSAWAAATRRALASAPVEAFGPGDPRGRVELRRALAAYLGRTRGVRTDPEHVVVCSGFAAGLRLLAQVRGAGPGAGAGDAFRPVGAGGPEGRARRRAGGGWAVESYGLPFHHGILDAAGVRQHLLPVDADGARTDLLGAAPAEVRTALLTPAHQFPTGVPLLPARRVAAVEWARARADALLVEDDYDGEFRYDRKPIGSVQGVAPDRVAYVGSVSKSMSPAVRLGWLVLPDALVEPVLALKGEREQWASVVEQLALAELMECGAYDRHVRRTRQRYRERRERLAAALPVSGVAAGLHAVLELGPGREAPALAAARTVGLSLDGLSEYRHRAAGGEHPVREGLVIGYAGLGDHAFDRALDLLTRVARPFLG